jgi:large subunit ribosomal protein L10
MTLSKDQKKNLIDGLNDGISRAKSIVFTGYQGLKVSKMQELRKQLREREIDLKVTKNTLLAIALKNNQLEVGEEILSKPLAVISGYSDEVEPCKIINDFAKSNENLKILGGIVDKKFIDAGQVKTLAMMPSRDELYAKLVGSCAAPISGFVNVLAGNLRGLVQIIKAYKDNKEKNPAGTPVGVSIK